MPLRPTPMEMKIMYDDAEEMSSSSSADVKLAKKAWIVPGQRIDYTFEIEMQAMSGEKLPFIVRATSFPVAPRTDDNDDNLSRHFNDDLVRGVFEFETRALVASMTMEEIFRRTISSSINHQSVFESSRACSSSSSTHGVHGERGGATAIGRSSWTCQGTTPSWRSWWTRRSDSDRTPQGKRRRCC